jgi:small subunit ribosomal protein S3
MGQKVHPESMRVGYIHDWKSNWFNEKHFADYLAEDVAIRRYITNRLAHAGLSDITIRKDANEVEVNINTARPGIVIGKSGSEVDQVRRDLHRMTGKGIKVNILEIKRPSSTRSSSRQSIAEQLVNRVAFRRAMKRALTSAMRSGAKGCKIQVGGRLGGAEMARTEMLLRRPSPAAHAARGHRLRLLRGPHHLRPHRREVLDQRGEVMPEGYAGEALTSLDEPKGGRAGRSRRSAAVAVATAGTVAAAAAAAVAGGTRPAVPGVPGGRGGGGGRGPGWPRRPGWVRRGAAAAASAAGGGRGGGGGGRGGQGGGRQGGGSPQVSR